MRTHYETEEDLKIERVIADIMEKVWKAKFYKLPDPKFAIDFLVEKDNRFSWLELKRANRKYDQYPNFMISYKKIEQAKLLSETAKIPFILMFKCLDCICYHKWDFDKQYEFGYGGRTKTTRDAGDVEPMFYIPYMDCVKVHFEDWEI